MSLARSASGPGGLTINTNAANTLNTSTSATTTQPPAAGSLFGSPATTTTGPASATATTATAAATAAGTSGAGMAFAAKPTSGLFGGSALGAANTTAGTSPFGASTNTQQNQPSAGGGLFGNSNAGNQQQQPQQPAAGTSLFGGGQTQQQQQPPQPSIGGLNTAGQQAQNQQQPQQTGGLFGSSMASNTQPATGGGGGLFGQSQAKPAGGLFGGATSQPQQAQPTTQVPAVQINFDNVRPRTRFDDLAQPVQEQIALIDKGIARVIKMKDEIGEFMPQHERDIEQLGRDVKFVESKFRGVQVALDRDIQTVKVLQDMTKKNIADAQLSFKATDNLKLPTHYHQTGLFANPAPASSPNNAAAAAAGAGGAADASATHADAQHLITYFNRICDDLEKYKKRLDEYRGEIERDMPGVENGLFEQIRALRDSRHAAGALGENGNGSSMQDQLGQVLLALRETGTAIINQAGKIADTRERLSRLQSGILDSGVYALGMAA